MDGLALSYVVAELQHRLNGGRVDRVLQPDSDELHLVIRTHEENARLLFCTAADSARVHLTHENTPNPAEPPMFCMLMRKLLTGSRVREIRQVNADRVIEIVFECLDELGEKTERILSCEMMGRHSNLILRDRGGKILDCIRHVGADVNRVRELKPGIMFVPPPAQNKLNPQVASIEMLREALKLASPRLDKAISEMLTGFSAQSAREIAYRLCANEEAYLDEDKRVQLAEPLRCLLDELPSFGPPVILSDGEGNALDVFPFEQRHISLELQHPQYDGMSAALDALYLLKGRKDRMAQKSASLSKSIRTHIERCEKKLAIYLEEMNNESDAEENRICGELLTANLHRITKGQTQIKVEDYYDPDMGIKTICLDASLSPGQNAQRYYKLYQKMREARKHAQKQVELVNEELIFLQQQLDDVRKCVNLQELDEIREELVKAKYIRPVHGRNKGQKARPTKLAEVVSSEGLIIRYGRNSIQNERITASALPEEIWLHAKDIPGSHVVIVGSQNGVGDQTLLEAATIAAWYSKAYLSTMVPVDYAKKKYVKKRQNSATGQMLYTHQKTLFIKPDERIVKKLLGQELVAQNKS